MALSEAVLTLTVIVNLLNVLFIASLAGFYSLQTPIKPNLENTFISKSQKQNTKDAQITQTEKMTPNKKTQIAQHFGHGKPFIGT